MTLPLFKDRGRMKKEVTGELLSAIWIVTKHSLNIRTGENPGTLSNVSLS